MAKVYKSGKKRYGVPTKPAKPIGETSGTMPSTTYGENSKRRMNEAREAARKGRPGMGLK